MVVRGGGDCGVFEGLREAWLGRSFPGWKPVAQAGRTVDLKPVVQLSLMGEKMAVTLQDVTRANFDACVLLKVREDQRVLVAPNVLSLAQAYVIPSLVPFAICEDDNPVGFAMYNRVDEVDPPYYYLMRLMVGAEFQRNGFAREAILLLLERFRMEGACSEVRASYADSNEAVEKLFASLGFERVGRINERHEVVEEGGEVLVRLGL